MLFPYYFYFKEDDIETMKALLVLGADPALVDNKGKTAFQYVKENLTNYQDMKELFDMFNYQDKGTLSSAKL